MYYNKKYSVINIFMLIAGKYDIMEAGYVFYNGDKSKREEIEF